MRCGHESDRNTLRKDVAALNSPARQACAPTCPSATKVSVRTKPSCEQVQEAEALCARMRSKSAAGSQRIALHHGRVVRPGLVGRLQRMAQHTLGKRIALSSGGRAAIGMVVGGYAASFGTISHLGAGAALPVIATLAAMSLRSQALQSLCNRWDLPSRPTY